MRKAMNIIGLIWVVLAFLPVSMSQGRSHTSLVGVYTTIDDRTVKPRSVMRVTERGGVFYATVQKVFRQPGNTRGFAITALGGSITRKLKA